MSLLQLTRISTFYSVIIEVTSLQRANVSKNEQIEELQSKLEEDEKVKELESIQERKSYVTLQLN